VSLRTASRIKMTCPYCHQPMTRGSGCKWLCAGCGYYHSCLDLLPRVAALLLLAAIVGCCDSSGGDIKGVPLPTETPTATPTNITSAVCPEIEETRAGRYCLGYLCQPATDFCNAKRCECVEANPSAKPTLKGHSRNKPT
jgi:hypothetical protein